MIFSANIEPSCAYCVNGALMANCDDDIICQIKGIVSPAFSCSKYRYDPLKRIPPQKIVKLEQFSDGDFDI